MNPRIVSTLLLAMAVVSGVHAQTELPSQWVDTQIKAARQDQRNSGERNAVAAKAAAAKPATTPEPAQNGPASAASPVPQSVATVAKMGATTQK